MASLLDSATSVVTSSVASVSTGLSAIPGGAGAIASVVNNATGAINSIPGTASISNLIGSATSAVSNGLAAVGGAIGSAGRLAGSIPGLGAVAGLAGAATGIAGAASGLLGKLAGGTATLSSLASTGLSPAAAAQMQAAISSLSSGGSVPIKLPVVALNTTDRGEIASQLSSVFGSSKIAAPNFSGNPATFGTSPAIAEMDARNALIRKAVTALDHRSATERTLIDAQTAFKNAENVLPAGDPQLAIIKAKMDAAYARYSVAYDEFKAATAAAS